MKSSRLSLLLIAIFGIGDYYFGIHSNQPEIKQTAKIETKTTSLTQEKSKKISTKTVSLNTISKQEKVFYRDGMSDPSSIDPLYADIEPEMNIVQDAFYGLLVVGKEGRAVAGLCKSWDVSEDGMKYTFHLRDNLKFSNGDPLTVEDIVFTYQRAVDPKSAAKYVDKLFPIKNAKDIIEGRIEDVSKLGVYAVDNKTIVIETEHPKPFFEEDLIQSITFVIPKKLYLKHGREWSRAENIVSSGPYRVVNWKAGEYVELEKNPYFFAADDVKIDRVFFYPIEGVDTAFRQYRAGEIDFTKQVPLTKIAMAKKLFPDDLVFNPFYVSYYYAFNFNHKPFQDVRVRKALSLVVDRRTFTTKILKHGYFPLYSFTSPGMHNYTRQEVDFKDDPMEQRIAEAQKLMAEAGYTKENPLKFELSYNTYEIHETVAAGLQSMFQDNLPVEVMLTNSEASVHYANLGQKNYQLGRAAMGISSGDAFEFISLFDSKSPQNYPGFKNEEIDRLIDEASKMTDLNRRREVLQRLERMIMDQHPVIPLFNYSMRYLVNSKKVIGFKESLNYANHFPTYWFDIKVEDE